MKKSVFERLEAIKRKKDQLKKQELNLKILAGKEKTKKYIRLGELIEKAGLIDLDKNVLLGALLEIKSLSLDSEKLSSWEKKAKNFDLTSKERKKA